MSLANRTIALAEGRQLEELAQMLEKDGATVVRCPLLSILDPADDGPALAWLRELTEGRFDLIVLLTGEGLRRLLACADRHDLRAAVIGALGRTRIITRGPKPVRALKEVNLVPSLVAQAPTTDGVIAALQSEDLRGKTFGVQLYSDSNLPLTQFLIGAGATVRTVQPYVYAPAADDERVAGLFDLMDQAKVDAIVFTSSPQIDRLFEVAHERGAEGLLMRGLGKTKIAAVGPIVAETLQKRGLHAAICPEQGFVMKNLVQLIKRSLA
jgi:uroporphyrinogen-III synthase